MGLIGDPGQARFVLLLTRDTDGPAPARGADVVQFVVVLVRII